MIIILKPHQRRHPLLLGVAAVFTAGMLSGCSLAPGEQPPSTGRTHEDAEKALTALPHITAATIETSFEGTPNQVMLMVHVSADAGFSADLTDLLDYTLKQAWSATEKKPTTTVRVDLGLDGNELDLEALADHIDVAGTVDAKDKYDPSLRIHVSDMEAAHGTWPGPAPSPPTALAGPVENR